MSISKEKIVGGDGVVREVSYKIVNGTAYKEKTPDNIIQIIEEARNDRNIRLRFQWGDVSTGRDWGGVLNTAAGYIGRSTGSIKIPLLIKTTRSHGGESILDDCIVKIERKYDNGPYVLVYQHPTYYKVAA